MPARDFMELMVQDSVEPFGEKRADIQTGQIAQIIANIHRDTKKRPQPYELEDFIPKYFGDRPAATKPQQSPEEQVAFMFALQAAQNKPPN